MGFRSYLLILAVLLLVQCELFTPRVPDPPLNSNDPYAWVPPTYPDAVLDNLSSAFPTLKTNYHLDCLAYAPDLSPQFTFIPDQTVASSQPDIFAKWGYLEEESFITSLFSMLAEDGLQRLTWDIQQSSSIEAQYEIIADYDLQLSFNTSKAPLPNQIQGQATLTLRQNDDLLYEILTWQDLKNDSLPSWSDLKTLVQ